MLGKVRNDSHEVPVVSQLLRRAAAGHNQAEILDGQSLCARLIAV
jgi:hypothetical protein